MNLQIPLVGVAAWIYIDEYAYVLLVRCDELFDIFKFYI